MSPRFADKTQPSLPLWLAACALPEGLPDGAREWAEACGFTGAAGQVCLLPGEDGLAGAIYGIGPEDRLARDPFAPAAAGAALPEGIWRLAGGPAGVDRFAFALGWLLTAYRFDKYKKSEAKRARLVAPDGLDAARIEIMAEAEFLTRDLINTPANDLGPAALEDAARELARDCGMAVKVIAGDDLLDQNFPLIHTVGRAGRDAPRLIEMSSGTEGPSLTLVGKGVCFDTGGLNIKPGASMGLMKKDMGGAAAVLGLTQMLARTGAAKGMRLRVLIPAVENAIAGNAFRPGDILASRKGLSVEVNNTDAEGRLILADALAYGAEDAPDLMISMATLTGAARVALGPDLPPLYCDDDSAAAALLRSGMQSCDPLWRMPFWDGYEKMIEPGIADLDNAPSGGMAGSITAALFLRRFAAGARRYAHLDIYGWRPSDAPARAKGGLGQGARAILTALPELLP